MRRSGLSRTTLFAIIADLVTAGTLVSDLPEAASGRARGRPAQVVAINPNAGSYLGVDIGRAHAHVVIVNAAHEVVARGSTSFRADAAWSARVRRAVKLVDDVVDRGEVSVSGLRGIGLALQGLVEEPMAHAGSGKLRDSAALATERFRAWRDVPVTVDNNTRAAALAEQTWGAARGLDDVLYLRCSDGVSSGIISGGHLLRGAHGAAGEIGHVQIGPRGPACYCGSRGCLELYVGVPGLLQECADGGRQVKDAAHLVELARAGEPVVRPVVAKAVARLGAVVAATAAQFDPSRIIVAGELAGLGELITTPLRDAVARHALPAFPRDIEVVGSTLDEDAPALGAIAHLLREEAARRPADAAP